MQLGRGGVVIEDADAGSTPSGVVSVFKNGYFMARILMVPLEKEVVILEWIS